MTTFFLARDVISYVARRFISTSTVTSGEELACFANSRVVMSLQYYEIVHSMTPDS